MSSSTTPDRPRNLAARMGRWSAGHWKTATFGWLALVVVAFGIGGMVGMKNTDPNTAGPGESGRMDRILHADFKRPAAESVLVQSGTATAGTPTFDAAVKDVVARVSRETDVQNVRSPLAPGNADQISKDGHAALVEFEIRGEIDKAPDKVGPVLDAVAAAQAAHPGFFIGEMGDASAPKAVMDQYGKDLAKAGTLSLPITLIILIVTFGALVAAGIPLLLALTAVVGTFGLVAIVSHVLPMANEVPALVLLIGLAVGVDYSMFYLRREREERAKGRSERAALEAAAATSGRSVLISGLTVMVAMAGMFVTGDKTFASFGVATMMVVAVAMLGSLTVLPALLSRLGDRVDRFRVRRRRDNGGESRMWGWIVDRVLRRPALSAAIAGGVLLVLALPAIQMRMADASPDTFPAQLDVVKTYKRMQQAFPGTALPANVIVKAPSVNAPAVREAISRLEQRALASGRAHEPITIAVNKAGTVANITIPINGNGSDKASNRSLALLRHTIIPETVGALPNTEAGVTGLTAQWKDSGDEIRSALPWVVGFVLVFAFALMLVAFRSIVVALKAIVLNCLSVAAAYGILVLVFQHGVGKGLLGFTDTTGVSPVIPLLLFVILFGLSMDYHVFIVSRIRERFQRGATMDEAISDGIRSTGSVVTSAAIVMVCVFAVFATLSVLFFKQFGVGLAAAILIDATIVRGVLLPATMKLLGERNWYLPAWLEWLPHFDHGELEIVDEPEPEQAPPTRKPKRRLGFARVTGLLLIAILALGLAYVKVASGGDKVSVPAGAKAGQLSLRPCRSSPSARRAADCGTLVVPENRAEPGSRLIGVRVIRIKARSAHPGAPVFRLEGGPGGTNMHFAKASRLAENHDVVLVGYRGIDSSVRLDCPEVSSALKRSADLLSQKSYDGYTQAFRDCAVRLQEDGVDLAGYTLPDQVDDLEAARRAPRYGRVNLVSESSGTRLAMIYAWRLPPSINRSVLIAVIPPGHFLWDPKATDELIGRYSRLCARDAGCSKRSDDLAASMRRTAAHMPRRFWGLPISAGNAKIASFYGLMESTSFAEPLSAPETIDSWISAAHGDPSGLWFQSLIARMAFPDSFVWGEVAAVARADTQAADRYFGQGPRRKDSILGNPGTEFLYAGGGFTHAFPRAPDSDEYARVRASNVPTLLVNGALDFATPAKFGIEELLPHLRNGKKVLLAEQGHSGTFWSYEPKAGTRLGTRTSTRARSTRRSTRRRRSTSRRT